MAKYLCDFEVDPDTLRHGIEWDNKKAVSEREHRFWGICH